MNDSINIEWKGGFEQFGIERKAEFGNMFMDVNGNLYGAGYDQTFGNYQICGTWSEKKIEFIIQYFSSHIVMYTGTTKDGKRFEGDWEIDHDNKGTFWIEICMQKWTGTYTQNKNTSPLSMEMSFNEAKASGTKNMKGSFFGTGKDDEGFYVIRGTQDMVYQNVSFTKSYIEDEIIRYIHYNGTFSKQNGLAALKGYWTEPGKSYGAFNLLQA